MNPLMKMFEDGRHRRPFAQYLLALVFLFVVAISSAHSQAPQAYWRDARTLSAAELGLDELRGLAFDRTAGAFYVMGIRAATGAGAVSLANLAGDRLGVYDWAAEGANPQSAAFGDYGLFILDAAGDELVELSPIAPDQAADGPSPVLQPARRVAAGLALADARGMAVESATGRVFILDAAGPALVQVDPAAAGAVGRTRLDVGASALSGLAFDPASGLLYTAAADGRAIFVLGTDGRPVAMLDVAKLGLGEPRALVIATSGDPTDEPDTTSLYLIDATGRLVELYLRAPAAPPAVPAIAPSRLKTVRTSVWSPASPDPSGIDFHPGLKQLVIGDSEVEEMSIFHNANMFLASSAGVLSRTCLTSAFSNEPAGVAVNPANGSIFIGDDNNDRIYEVSLGADKLYCTADDRLTSFDTRAFGSFDPEGLAFGTGKLLIADGEGAELYIIAPGANGRFDGRAPTGDDQLVGHFDTLGLGIEDPEGVGFHPGRGTLFFASRFDEETLFEVSMEGRLLYKIGIGALKAIVPAGAAIGPSSWNPAKMSAYVVDRGIDNEVNPRENDGRLFEIGLDNLPPLPAPNPIYISHLADTSAALLTPRTGDEDILYFNGRSWSLFFDGSDVGLAALDLDAFYILDADSILLSFSQQAAIGALGQVDDSDIVRFDATSLGNTTAGSFSLYFDASDVGLSTPYEDVDALSVLPNGRLVVSTVAGYIVGALNGAGDDLLAFAPTSLGANTAGSWSLYFDGSDVGITPAINIDGVSIRGNGDIYLTTVNNFKLSGRAVADEDVLLCHPTSLGTTTRCNFDPALYFDGSAWKLGSDDIDAIQVP